MKKEKDGDLLLEQKLLGEYEAKFKSASFTVRIRKSRATEHAASGAWDNYVSQYRIVRRGLARQIKFNIRDGSIVTPPGTHVATFFGRFVSKRTRELVLAETRDDDLNEYYEALKNGDNSAAMIWAMRLRLRPIATVLGSWIYKAWAFLKGRNGHGSKADTGSAGDGESPLE